MATETTKNFEKTTKIIYFLYIASVILGFTIIVGVVMAYIYRSDVQEEWLKTHYQFLIRTFWLGLIGSIISVILCIIIIGYFIGLAVMVWLIIRCVKGLKYLDEQKAIPDPTTFLIP